MPIHDALNDTDNPPVLLLSMYHSRPSTSIWGWGVVDEVQASIGSLIRVMDVELGKLWLMAMRWKETTNLMVKTASELKGRRTTAWNMSHITVLNFSAKRRKGKDVVENS